MGSFGSGFLLRLLPFVVLAALLLAPVWIMARAGGDINGRSGGPAGAPWLEGTGTCSDAASGCHTSAVNSDPAGGVSISVSKENYAPGEDLTVTVSVSHPSQEAYGFELAAIAFPDTSPRPNAINANFHLIFVFMCFSF